MAGNGVFCHARCVAPSLPTSATVPALLPVLLRPSLPLSPTLTPTACYIGKITDKRQTRRRWQFHNVQQQQQRERRQHRPKRNNRHNTRNIQPTTHYPLPTTYDLPTSCYHLLPIHWILHQHEQRALAGQAQPLPRRYGVVRTFFLSPGDSVLHFPNH